ncbi:hypothetical protein NQZ68_007845 [Dissostichus eleginoides]|nr:hypothetical protein NQZ68_007845 [Dissostichus eleginoides]
MNTTEDEMKVASFSWPSARRPHVCLDLSAKCQVLARVWGYSPGANRSFMPQARARAGSRCSAETHHVGWVMLGGLQPGNFGASTTTQMDHTAEGREDRKAVNTNRSDSSVNPAGDSCRRTSAASEFNRTNQCSQEPAPASLLSLSLARKQLKLRPQVVLRPFSSMEDTSKDHQQDRSVLRRFIIKVERGSNTKSGPVGHDIPLSVRIMIELDKPERHPITAG